uniref:Interleukin 4 n=1 Tax=Nothoprocta perdicaria TaxID=30464 RepID=A0A8C6YP73_NOTPE
MCTKLAGLLAVCCLLACRSHEAALPPSTNFLNENIRLLQNIMNTKVRVSCAARGGTGGSAGLCRGDKEAELLCKAATVAGEGQSCHRQLQGISLNLQQLVRQASAVPCPVAAGNTTSLKHFLQDLNRFHKQLAKKSQF